MDGCLKAQPPLYTVGEGGHEAACYLYESKSMTLPHPASEFREQAVLRPSSQFDIRKAKL